jgi:hypothetical protein
MSRQSHVFAYADYIKTIQLCVQLELFGERYSVVVVSVQHGLRVKEKSRSANLIFCIVPKQYGSCCSQEITAGFCVSQVERKQLSVSRRSVGGLRLMKCLLRGCASQSSWQAIRHCACTTPDHISQSVIFSLILPGQCLDYTELISLEPLWHQRSVFLYKSHRKKILQNVARTPIFIHPSPFIVASIEVSRYLQHTKILFIGF